MTSNKQRIENLANEMLDNSLIGLRKNITRAISSSAIDVDEWSPTDNLMLLPRAILIAVIEEMLSSTYELSDRVAGKEVRKEADNIRLFL